MYCAFNQAILPNVAWHNSLCPMDNKAQLTDRGSETVPRDPYYPQPSDSSEKPKMLPASDGSYGVCSNDWLQNTI